MDDTPIPEMTPGELRGALIELRLTTAAAGAWLGVGAGTIRHWALGERPIPMPVAMLVRLARKDPAFIARSQKVASVVGAEAAPRKRGRPAKVYDPPTHDPWTGEKL